MYSQGLATRARWKHKVLTLFWKRNGIKKLDTDFNFKHFSVTASLVIKVWEPEKKFINFIKTGGFLGKFHTESRREYCPKYRRLYVFTSPKLYILGCQ